MSRLLRHFPALVLVQVMLCASLRADDAALAPQDGLLLLRTGGVVSGRITRAGDRYYVAVPDGEIRLKASEVDLVCRDLEDGYSRKRAAAVGHGAEGHLDLCQWCLREGLLDHAKQE